MEHYWLKTALAIAEAMVILFILKLIVLELETYQQAHFVINILATEMMGFIVNKLIILISHMEAVLIYQILTG